MRAIWEFKLNDSGDTQLNLRGCALCYMLGVGWSDGQLLGWAVVDTSRETSIRYTVLVRATWDSLGGEDEKASFVGTAGSGEFVRHAFLLTEVEKGG